jgi:type VI secretion system secreted protein VgrG
MSEKDLKKFAQQVVEKTNKLAETPLEKKVPGINAALAKSDALKTNIVKLQAAKWKIKLNAPGKGSFCDKVNKTIAIDPSDPLADTLGGLAHESGHALYTPPPKPTVKNEASGLDYVRKATEVDFLDEGEAQMVACRSTAELKTAGEASKVPADSSGAFMAIYEKFVKGDLSEDEARKEMAKKFGGLITSTTKESYIKYYGGFHLKTWNAAHKKEPAKQLDKSVLDTLVLFP